WKLPVQASRTPRQNNERAIATISKISLLANTTTASVTATNIEPATIALVPDALKLTPKPLKSSMSRTPSWEGKLGFSFTTHSSPLGKIMWCHGQRIILSIRSHCLGKPHRTGIEEESLR